MGFILSDDIDNGENGLDVDALAEALSMMSLDNESETVDYQTRQIVINGQIDASTMEKYIVPIISINKEDEGLEPEDRQPITLYISCVGGDVSQGLALVDVIQASKTPIIGVTLPYAYSMGCMIAIACHKRYCYKRSMFLIHDGFVGNEASTSKFKDFLKFLTIQEKQLKDLILSTTKITKSQLDKKFATEWYIDANTALELGMIDEILTEIK